MRKIGLIIALIFITFAATAQEPVPNPYSPLRASGSKMPGGDKPCPDAVPGTEGQVVTKDGDNNCAFWDDIPGLEAALTVGLDLGGDGANSLALTEIIVLGDTNNVFTEDNDELTIDLSQPVPFAGHAVTAENFAIEPTSCEEGESATGVDASGNAVGCFVPDVGEASNALTADALNVQPNDTCSIKHRDAADENDVNVVCFDDNDEATFAGTADNALDVTCEGCIDDGALASSFEPAGVDADEVTNTPAGNIAATDVQAAINELDTEKQAAGTYATNSFTTFNAPSGTDPQADSATDTLNLTTNSPGIGISGDSSTDTLQFQIVYTNTLAGNPNLGANACVFSNEGNGGGFLCEGSENNNTETLFLFPDLTSSDATRTIMLVPASSSAGNCAEFDSNGQVVDSGGECGGGGGGGAEALDDLTDVEITAPSTGHILQYDTDTWENVTPSFLKNTGTLDDGEFCVWLSSSSHLNCNVPLGSLANLNSLLGGINIVDTGTRTNGRLCTWDNSGNEIDCDTTNAPTATALAANPDNCSTPGQVAVGIAADGSAECSAVSSADVTFSSGDFEASVVGGASGAIQELYDKITTPVDGGPNDDDSFIDFSVLTNVPEFRKTLFQLGANGAALPDSAFAFPSSWGSVPVLRFNGDVCAWFVRSIPTTYGGNGFTVEFEYRSTETSGDTDWDGSWDKISGADGDSRTFSTPVSSDNNNNNGTSGIPTKVSIVFANNQIDSCGAGDMCILRICRDATSDTGGANTIDYIGGQVRETL